MKKLVFVVSLLLCLVLCLPLFVGCKSNLQKAAANADDYTIVATYDPTNHTLSATQVVQLTNRSNNSFNDVKFHIYANQYRQDAASGVVPNGYHAQAYPNGDSWGNISVESVKVNDQAVAYVVEGQDMDILSVPMQQELFPNKRATVELTYTVTLANVAHRLGYTDNAVNLGNWYPVLCAVQNDNYACTPYYNVGDPFVSSVANYDVTLVTPADYVVAASGELAQTTAMEGNFVSNRYVATASRDFAAVLSNKYTKISHAANGVAVNYYYFADQDPAASLATAVGAMDFCTKKVGKYPFGTYNVCQTDFCYGGMEYSGLAMVAAGAQGYTQAIAHETAHQWFYGVVGNDQIAHAWMDEGLAQFVTYWYLDSIGTTPLATSIAHVTKTYATYVDVLDSFYTNVDRSFRPIADYKSDKEYVMFTYVKGSLLFATLFETMGEARFAKALATYYNDAAFCLATPQQMAQCFAKCGNAEIATVFEQFIDGKEIVGEIRD